MAQYSDTLTDEITGAPLPGVKVYVYGPDDQLASLTDNGGNLLTQPLTSDQFGGYEFNALAAVYKLDYRYGGRRLFLRVGVPVGVPPIDPNTLAALSASSGAALIGSIGPSNVQADISALVLKRSEDVSVLDFIPAAQHAAIYAGTSTYDAAPAFRAAAATGRLVRVPGVGRYYLSSTVVVGGRSTFVDLTNCAGIEGEGSNGAITAATKLYAAVAVDDMFRVGTPRTTIRNLYIDGTYVAKCGIRVAGGNSSTFEMLFMQSFKQDGIHFAVAEGNNSSSRVSDCGIFACGTAYGTGTASNGANSTTVTIAGAASLLTLGIRPGLDMVRVGSGRYYTISNVTATTLTTTDPIPNANSGATYTIFIGCGIAIPSFGDNSVIVIEKNTFQNCQVAAVRDNALYGAIAKGNIYESNGYGRVIGVAGSTCIGAVEEDGYFEFSGSGSHVLIEQATDARVDIGVGGIPAVSIPNVSDARVTGLVIEAEGVRLDKKTTLATNVTTFPLAFTKSYAFSQSSGASNATLVLPSLPDAYAILGVYEVPIPLVFLDIGGKTFTVTTANGVLVNGIAGSTGVAVTGNYVERTARYNPAYGWSVT